MSEHTPYYLHLDNGDYSIKEETIGDLLSTIEFELEKGGAKQLMVTKEFQEGHPLHTTSKLIADNKRLKTALQELLVAVCYKTPTVDFGTDKEPNPCYEARVPVQFVHDAHQAINESE